MPETFSSLYLLESKTCCLFPVSISSFLDHGCLNPSSSPIPLDEIVAKIPPESVVIVNIEPFSNLKLLCQILKTLPFRKIANICDSHHGEQPITRLASFCVSSGISSCLIRFNQRHSCWFERLGITTASTVFSPDLSQLISQGFLSRLTEQNRLDFVIHVGSLSPHHVLRSKVYQSHRENPLIHWKRFPDVQSMLIGMSRFKYSLNISLNLDFNRRIIESLMAGCQLFSDQLEDLQFQQPFDLINSNVSWYSSLNSLTSKLINRSSFSSQPQETILNLHASDYDKNLRANLLSNCSFSRPRAFCENLRNLYYTYDFIQGMSQRCCLHLVDLSFLNQIPLSREPELAHSIDSLVKLGLLRSRSYG